MNVLAPCIDVSYVFCCAFRMHLRAQFTDMSRRYNKVTMPPFHDMQGHFYNGDSGRTVCTYPNGKLGNGMRYDTLVSAGFTSPVIAGLIADGTPASLQAALDVVGDIRNRQDGRTASPWNEPECTWYTLSPRCTSTVR